MPVLSFVENNSGATLDSGTGEYTAGATGGVQDTVRVTDGQDHTADAVVTINP